MVSRTLHEVLNPKIIQLKESEIPLTIIEIRNLISTQKESGIQYLKSRIHDMQSRIQDTVLYFLICGKISLCSKLSVSTIASRGNTRLAEMPASYLPTLLPVFQGVSQFFIKSPGLPVRAPNLPGNTYRMAFFKIFSFISLFLRCPKGK